MKIVIAPDSFKESMTALEVSESIERGFKKVFPEAEYIKLPIGDGGEGTVQSFVDLTGGALLEAQVTGPLGEQINGYYGLSSNGQTAYLEMAAAAGLHLVPSEKRNPFKTTTFGVGECILHALDQGAQHIILGIGGSATNDGGIGMAAALGVRFYNQLNEQLAPNTENLINLHSIDITDLDPRLQNVRFEVACDVTNPLVGKEGATYVFGLQKGASPQLLPLLDRYLAHYANVLKHSLRKDVKDIPGSGAGGGMGAAAIAFLGANLKSGIEVLLDYVQFDKLLEETDLVITGEGKMDHQTIYGKAPIGVAKRAQRKNIPVLALAGEVAEGYQAVYAHGITSVISIANGSAALAEALSNGQKNTEVTAENIARLLKISDWA